MEIGPGHGLRMLASQLEVWGDEPPTIVASLRHALEHRSDVEHALDALGRAWAAGAVVDWKAVHAHERLRRVPLPTYPFQRERFWIDRPAPGELFAHAAGPEGWLYSPPGPPWPPRWPPPTSPPPGWCWRTVPGLAAGWPRGGGAGAHGAAVEVGDAFARAGGGFTARPGSAADLGAVREALGRRASTPRASSTSGGSTPRVPARPMPSLGRRRGATAPWRRWRRPSGARAARWRWWW